jgi:hypothetical protein
LAVGLLHIVIVVVFVFVVVVTVGIIGLVVVLFIVVISVVASAMVGVVIGIVVAAAARIGSRTIALVPRLIAHSALKGRRLGDGKSEVAAVVVVMQLQVMQVVVMRVAVKIMRMEMKMERGGARHFSVAAAAGTSADRSGHGDGGRGGVNSVVRRPGLSGSGRPLLIAAGGRMQQESGTRGVLRVLHVRVAIHIWLRSARIDQSNSMSWFSLELGGNWPTNICTTTTTNKLSLLF